MPNADYERLEREMKSNIARLDDSDLDKEVSFADEGSLDGGFETMLWMGLLRVEKARRIAAAQNDRSEGS